MKPLIALAPGLLASGAAAQTNVIQTTVTPSDDMTMVRTKTVHHSDMSDDNKHRHHARRHRVCRASWRHHQRIRACRTERWR